MTKCGIVYRTIGSH